MRMEKVIYQSMFNIFAEYYTTGNKRLTEKSFVILSSVTGTTQEVVQAVQEIKKVGATLFGFIDAKDSLLADLCDYVVTYPARELSKSSSLW